MARDENLLEDIERLRPSERLRMWAKFGGTVRSWGPIEEDFNAFAWRLESVPQARPIMYSEGMEMETWRENLHSLHQSGRWAQYGFNVFDLTPDLAAGFLMTEPAPLGDSAREAQSEQGEEAAPGER